MNSEGHIYNLPPQGTLDAMDRAHRKQIAEDRDRFLNLVELTEEEQQAHWRGIVAERKASRLLKQGDKRSRDEIIAAVLEDLAA